MSNILVLDRTPEAFDEDIVKDTAATIHADANVSRLQFMGKVMGGELNPLVGVENIWPAKLPRQPQRFQTEGAVQGIGELPGQDKTAEPIHDGHQVHEATR